MNASWLSNAVSMVPESRKFVSQTFNGMRLDEAALHSGQSATSKGGRI